MKNPGLKLFDYIILIFSVLVIGIFILLTQQSIKGSPILKITSVDSEYIYSLEENQEIEIAGPIGHTHIIINNGEAFISESPCDNQLCVMMGSITKNGQWVACMPNRVFVSIEGGNDEAEIDVLSY